MANSVIYTRVSTDEQVKGASLDEQKRRCLNYANSMGFTNVEVFCDEGASAKTADRKELLKMIAYCQQNKGTIDALIVWKIDRFARRTEDHLALRTLLAKQGVRLHSV